MLKVWLPLNEDLRNQGLADVVVTNNGATVNNSGKIGKCYEFDGSDDYISLDSPELYDIIRGGSQPFTIAFWIYHADATRAILFGDYGLSGTIRFNIELNTSGSIRFYWAASPDFSATNTFAALNTWTHIAIAYDGSKIDFYTNGELTFTRSGVLTEKNKTSGMYYLGRDSRTGTTAFNGRLNDVRIYDEAISPKLAKEISKGLVLHYPLNRGGFGQDNLLLNSTIPTSGSGATGITKYITDDGLQKVVAESPNSNWCKFDNHNTTLPLTKGDSFTFSMMIKSPDSTKKPTVYFQSGLGYYSMQGTMSNNWSIIYYTGIWNIDNLSTNIHLGFSSAPGTYYIKYFKLEKGSIITPWVPNSADALYSSMGLDSNVEYDVSGYGNNGTVTGSLTYTSDTPRYNVSTHIGATNQKIHVSGLTTSGFGNSYSFAWWGKRSSNSQMFWGFSDGIRLNGMYIGNLWDTGDGSSNPLYKIGTTTQVTAPSTDVWHHYVMTGNGTKCYVYLDGELWAEAKTYKSISGTSIYINGWNSGTSYCSDNTSISDFRIYSTALDAEQVKALYNTPTSIANNGTLMTQGEISEV